MSAKFRHQYFNAKTKRSRAGVKIAFDNVTPREYQKIVHKASLDAGQAM